MGNPDCKKRHGTGIWQTVTSGLALASPSLSIVLVFLPTPAHGRQDDAQTLESKLGRVVSSYSSVRGRFVDGILAVGARFRLPIGIEWIDAGEMAIPDHSWTNATVLSILQDIVQSSPGYALDVSNGVVHIFPASLKDDPADVLNAHIGAFEVLNEPPPSIAALILPERLRTIMVRPIPPGPTRVLGGSVLLSGNESRVTFRLENPTVREVLDRLCQTASRNIWIVRYPAVLAKTNAGYWKTLRNDSTTVRDDADFFPSFDLLAWGMPYRVQ